MIKAVSKRVDGYKVYPYTIHMALTELSCEQCGGTIEPQELFIPWKDRAGDGIVTGWCWDCFPFEEFDEEG